jgi:hypothetical protein
VVGKRDVRSIRFISLSIMISIQIPRQYPGI